MGDYQRLQILTIRQLLAGAQVAYPRLSDGDATFKRAPKANLDEQGVTPPLFEE